MVRLTPLEREARLLDAAAELFLRYGYDKTTVDDIARAAGVSKGAVYLHFKGKNELFGALVLRETAAFADGWFAAVMADKYGGTLGGMYKAMLVGMQTSDFMTAVLRRDPTLLGNYIRQPDNLLAAAGNGQTTRHEVVSMMQAAGAVRDDVDAKVVAHLMNMISYGMVSLDGLIPQADLPPFDDLIEGIADIMDRAVTPSARLKASRAGQAVLQDVFEAGRAQLAVMQDRARPSPAGGTSKKGNPS